MTWDMPSFSPKCKLAEEFVSWISSAGGGEKDMNQAEQLCKNILKYCKYCCPNLDEDFEVTRSVGSVEQLQKFMTFLEEECKLASAGVNAYLQSLNHCLDFLRFQGLRADPHCHSRHDRSLPFRSEAVSEEENAGRMKNGAFYRAF